VECINVLWFYIVWAGRTRPIRSLVAALRVVFNSSHARTVGIRACCKHLAGLGSAGCCAALAPVASLAFHLRRARYIRTAQADTPIHLLPTSLLQLKLTVACPAAAGGACVSGRGSWRPHPVDAGCYACPARPWGPPKRQQAAELVAGAPPTSAKMCIADYGECSAEGDM
jgi:hypothetical protein